MSEDPNFSEDLAPIEPPAVVISNILEAAAHYRQGGDDGQSRVATVLAHASQRVDQLNELKALGLDHDEAIANIDAIEGRYSSSTSTDHALFKLQQETALRSVGLTLDDDADLPSVLVQDGAQFYEALSSGGLSDMQRERLAVNINGFFSGFIHMLQSNVIRRQEKDVVAILREDYDVNVWLSHDEEQPANEALSVEQTLAHANALAARIEEAGGNPQIAANLRAVATFEDEGDLVPWAVAGEIGLLPETRHETLTDLWEDWQTVKDWSPVFKILDASNPAGLFRDHLRDSVHWLIGKRRIEMEEFLSSDFETFANGVRQDWRDWSANDAGGSSPPPSEMELHESFARIRRQYQSKLETYDTVQQQLAEYRAGA